MKFSNKTALAAAFLAAAFLAAACTMDSPAQFQFGQLGNPLVSRARIEDKGDGIIHAISEESQLILKAKEYAGGGAAIENLKAKIKFSIGSAFGAFKSSYPGTISKSVTCDPSLLPELLENPANGAYGYLTQANDRHNFGVCDRKEIKFEMAYFAIQCASGSVYEVKVFLPTSAEAATKMRQLFTAFECR